MSNANRRKSRLQVWIEPELMDAINDVLATYRQNGRPAQKTAIIERLLRDGFRFWSREDQVSNRIEGTLATMADNLATTRAMQNALAFLHVGDEAAYQEYIAEVERRKGEL